MSLFNWVPRTLWRDVLKLSCSSRGHPNSRFCNFRVKKNFVKTFFFSLWTKIAITVIFTLVLSVRLKFYLLACRKHLSLLINLKINWYLWTFKMRKFFFRFADAPVFAIKNCSLSLPFVISKIALDCLWSIQNSKLLFISDNDAPACFKRMCFCKQRRKLLSQNKFLSGLLCSTTKNRT